MFELKVDHLDSITHNLYLISQRLDVLIVIAAIVAFMYVINSISLWFNQK